MTTRNSLGSKQTVYLQKDAQYMTVSPHRQTNPTGKAKAEVSKQANQSKKKKKSKKTDQEK